MVALGGLAPAVLAAGESDRIAGVIIPYAVATVTLGAVAVTFQRGRSLAAGLYFVAGLAIVYGMFLLVALPLRLAVVGACPRAAAHCAAGYERQLSSGETNAITVAIVLGMLAIVAGFFGLLIVFRRPKTPSA